MSPEVVLDINHLSFNYPDRPIFEDISLQVTKGEFVGIIGPNGGGKTTLLKLILGKLSPIAGTVSLLSGDQRMALPHIGYVPQVTHFDTQFPISVMELVLMGRLSHLSWWGHYSPKDRHFAEEALERVGLSDYKYRPLNTLSGGQAQRALIARALATQPAMLLLDEPTASVDPEVAREIYDLIVSLRTATTILMVTHELNTVINLVDRVLCIQNGVTSLAPQEVCAHFAVGLYHPRLVEKETLEP